MTADILRSFRRCGAVAGVFLGVAAASWAQAAVPAVTGSGKTQVPAAVAAAATGEIRGVRGGVHPGFTRIVVDLAAAAGAQVNTSTDARTWTVRLQALAHRVASADLARLRRLPGVTLAALEPAGGTSVLRLVFASPSLLSKQFSLTPDTYGPDRLVLDFQPANQPDRLARALTYVATASGGETGLSGARAPEPLAGQAGSSQPLATARSVQIAAVPGGDRPPTQRPEAPGSKLAVPQAPVPALMASPAGDDPAVAAPSDQLALVPQTDDDPQFFLDPPATRAYAQAAFDDRPARGSGEGGNPVRLSGFVEVEGRLFTRRSDEPPRDRGFGSLAAEPALEVRWADNRQLLRIVGFGRVDTVTDARTHADLREAKWVGAFGPVEFTLGVDRRFWGVTESVHLVDVLNQVDALEDIDREDKLGQPMASVAWTTPVGTLSGFILPYFREQRFPGAGDRPAGPLPVDRTQAVLPGGNHWTTDWAVRLKSVVGPLDLGLAYFDGINRDPRFVPGLDRGGRPVLVPVYDRMHQASIDAQATLGALLLKFEGYYRWDRVRDHGAFAAGFEYTLANLSGSGADLGLLAEYLHDGRGKAGPSPFDNDLFIGFRLAANDVASAELLAGVIFDLENSAKAINIEASRRMGERFKLGIDARLFSGVPPADPLFLLRDDGFIQVKLQYFF